MHQRSNPTQIAPQIYEALLALQKLINACGLEHSLLELVKMRASQINACAFCLGMHATNAVKAGVSQERLHLLPAWREVDLYTDRECAALAWTEALTLIADNDVPDALHEEARQHFSDKELANLSYAIAAINGWNRLMKAFRVPPPAANPAAP